MKTRTRDAPIAPDFNGDLLLLPHRNQHAQAAAVDPYALPCRQHGGVTTIGGHCNLQSLVERRENLGIIPRPTGGRGTTPNPAHQSRAVDAFRRRRIPKTPALRQCPRRKRRRHPGFSEGTNGLTRAAAVRLVSPQFGPPEQEIERAFAALFARDGSCCGRQGF